MTLGALVHSEVWFTLSVFFDSENEYEKKRAFETVLFIDEVYREIELRRMNQDG